ncbi:peptide ABC transporter substrate-binding protein [Blautia sp. OF03-15BH]|uniref:peptide ABC transporter substrate-binding protein n=1 Tax=Blautia sp. OF03-15BH TaxID=2292287 RepID=UPI000E4C7E2C|nr:peptide ABC transporter substrate-binding protein [Blautia sp. OF03-15BH]RGY01158.1 peptide ABC transporter substrate-binding protein [Blautia sp. OF03-15BH]
MKRKALATFFIACGCLAMVFGGTNVRADEEFTIDAATGYSEPHSMDPTLTTGGDQYEIIVHMEEGLMKFAPTTEAVGTNPEEMAAEIVPGQAESYEYDEDTLTYTFHLRDDIVWNDGTPVTADQFVYAWQRLVDPNTASSNGSLLNAIVKNAAAINAGEMDPSELGVEAPDDKTLVVTLENSCAYFLELTCSSQLMPLRQDVIEGNDTWTEAGTYCANGPYVMTEWVHDSYITLEKNEKYYDYENLGPDKITFHLSDSQTSNLAAYQSGDYDFISGVPADQIEALEASGDLFVNPRCNCTYLYLNVDSMTDWRVRAAVLLAIDRDNIVENVTQDGSTAAISLIPEAITTSEGESWPDAVGEVMYSWLQEQYPDYDLSDYVGRCELAQQLYQEAVDDGWNPDTSMDYQYNTSDTNKAIAEAVQSDLSNVLGINVTLNNIDSAGYTQTISQGGFYIARLGYGLSYNDAIGYFNLFGSNGSFEYSGWSNEKYDELVAQAHTMKAGTERDKVLEEIEAIMFTDEGFSICPLYDGSYTYCMDSTLKGVFYPAIEGVTIFSYAEK